MNPKKIIEHILSLLKKPIPLNFKGKCLIHWILILALAGCTPNSGFLANKNDIRNSNNGDNLLAGSNGTLTLKMKAKQGTSTSALPFSVLFQKGLPSDGFIDRYHNPTQLMPREKHLTPEDRTFQNGLYAMRTAKIIDLLYIRRDIAHLIGGDTRLQQLKKSKKFTFTVPAAVQSLYVLPDYEKQQLKKNQHSNQNSFVLVDELIQSLNRISSHPAANHKLRKQVLRQIVIESQLAGYVESCFIDDEARKENLKSDVERAIPFHRYFSEVMARSKILAIDASDNFFYRTLFETLQSDVPFLTPSCEVKSLKKFISLYDRNMEYTKTAFEETPLAPLYRFVFSQHFDRLYDAHLSQHFDTALVAWTDMNEHFLKKLAKPKHYDDNPDTFLLLATDSQLWKDTQLLFRYLSPHFSWATTQKRAQKMIADNQWSQEFVTEALLMVGGGALGAVGGLVALGSIHAILLIKSATGALRAAWAASQVILEQKLVGDLLILGGSAATMGAGLSAYHSESLNIDSKELFFSGKSQVDFERLIQQKEISESDYRYFVGSLFLFAGSSATMATWIAKGLKTVGQGGTRFIKMNAPFRKQFARLWNQASVNFTLRSHRSWRSKAGSYTISKKALQSETSTRSVLQNQLSQSLQSSGISKDFIGAVSQQFMKIPLVKLYRTDPEFRRKLNRFLLSDFIITTGTELTVRRDKIFDEIPFYLTDLAITATLVTSVVYRTHLNRLVKVKSGKTSGSFLDVWFRKGGASASLGQKTKESLDILIKPAAPLFKDSVVFGGTTIALSNLVTYGFDNEYFTPQERLKEVALTTLALAGFMGIACNGRMQVLTSIEHRSRATLKKTILSERTAKRMQNKNNMFGLAIQNDLIGSGLVSYTMSEIIEPARLTQNKNKKDDTLMSHAKDTDNYDSELTAIIIPKDKTLMVFGNSKLFSVQ